MTILSVHGAGRHLRDQAANLIGAAVLLGALAAPGCGGDASTPAAAQPTAAPSATTVSTTPPTSAATPPANLTARLTFANNQTGASGSCPASLAGQKVSGAGTWSLTPRATGEFDVAAEYDVGARSSGRLTVRTREAQLTEEGAVPGWTNRTTVSTYRFNETFEQGTGTSRVTLTAANGSQCVLTWDLTTAFATPLIPANLR